MTVRADYDWRHVQLLSEQRTTTVIEILDLDLGNMTVTNDIENVIAEIAAELPDDNPITEVAVMYRDTDGQWDEVILDKAGNFAQFAALPRGESLTELQSETLLRFIRRKVEAGS